MVAMGALVINDDTEAAITVATGQTLWPLTGRGISASLRRENSCGSAGDREGGGHCFRRPASDAQEARSAAARSGEAADANRTAATAFDIGRWQCQVLGNRNVSTFIKELTLKLPEDRRAVPRRRMYNRMPSALLSFRDLDIDAVTEEWDASTSGASVHVPGNWSGRRWRTTAGEGHLLFTGASPFARLRRAIHSRKDELVAVLAQGETK
jgi:Na+-transporting NADH:ubiquinone oxidoreductase subunit NqrF